MKETTKRRLSNKMKRRHILAFPVVLSSSVQLTQGFCPITVGNSWRLDIIETSQRRRPSWLGLSSNSEDKAVLHQQIKQADPEWYQEYVSNLLGEEYCSNRWPEIEVSLITPDATTNQEEEEVMEAIDEFENDALVEEKDDIAEPSNVDESLPEIADESEPTESSPSTESTITEPLQKQSEEDSKNEDTDETPENDDDNDYKTETCATTQSTDTRALVYRSIEGTKLTSVSLSTLLELGYSLSDLERIQAEFLSIVVMDKRPCPSMGVPSQWKIQDPKSPPQVTICDTLKEASMMAKEQNIKESEEKESVQKRRMRQEGRKETRSSPKKTTNRDENARKREPRRRREKEGERRRRTAESSASRDRSRRRREALDRDGNPRKIYKVPRDDTKRNRDDPPDPQSPLWVDMDTFRDLLQKEADFRMNFIGDDWSEVIAQENDWREDLYKGWLWSLNNGVGDSIVPPSRYERARRQQQSQSPSPAASSNNNKQRRRPPPKQQRPRRKTTTTRSDESERRSRRRARRPPDKEQ